MNSVPSRVRGRARQAGRVFRDGGARGVASRLFASLSRRLGGASQELPLPPTLVADSHRIARPPAGRPVSAGEPLRVGWITTPPAAGSGGHTTMLRMVEALERAGHECTLYLYDRYGGETSQHRAVIRRHWPSVRAEIRDVVQGLSGCDGLVATSWQTAHVLAQQTQVPGKRFYFVQDYEPYFYAHGSEYLLAEDTYRFGFHGITAGSWLSTMLGERFGMACDPFPFGADTQTYTCAGVGPRDGVVFYSKPRVPRRAFVLGVLALEEFHRRHPEAPIHLFGDSVAGLPFSAVQHGVVSPAELNEIYGQCCAGLSLSMTNVSLIPWELLACGVTPVVNGEEHVRQVLDNPYVAWAESSPVALAEGLSAVFRRRAQTTPGRIAASVGDATWERAGSAVVSAIERHIYGP